MSDDQPIGGEFLDLPDDAEAAFAVLQNKELERFQESCQVDSADWDECARRYVDLLTAFDEVHDLGLLESFRDPPFDSQKFGVFFFNFRRAARVAAYKIEMEMARRIRKGGQTIIVLDATSRAAIHQLIDAIRNKLNELTLDKDKRDQLFLRLNAFATEVDLNRTRAAAFYEFAYDASRAARKVMDNLGFNKFMKSIDRVGELIDKAKKLGDALPPWEERRKIEGPQKRLPGPDIDTLPDGDLDDEIPF